MQDIQADVDANSLAHTFGRRGLWYIKLEEHGLPCGSAARRCLDMVLQSVQVLKYKGPEMLIELGNLWLLLQSKPFYPVLESLQHP